MAMTKQSDNLVLELLRTIRAEQPESNARLDRMEDRLGKMEAHDNPV